MTRPRAKAEHPAEEPAVQHDHEPDAAPADEPRRPIQEFRLGRIKAAVWENETQLGVRYSVTFTRLYKAEGDPSWRTSRRRSTGTTCRSSRRSQTSPTPTSSAWSRTRRRSEGGAGG